MLFIKNPLGLPLSTKHIHTLSLAFLLFESLGICRTLCFNSPVACSVEFFCVSSLELKSGIDYCVYGCLCIINLDH